MNMKKCGIAGALLVFLAACGGSVKGPTVPPATANIAGTYAVRDTIAASSCPTIVEVGDSGVFDLVVTQSGSQATLTVTNNEGYATTHSGPVSGNALTFSTSETLDLNDIDDAVEVSCVLTHTCDMSISFAGGDPNGTYSCTSSFSGSDCGWILWQNFGINTTTCQFDGTLTSAN